MDKTQVNSSIRVKKATTSTIIIIYKPHADDFRFPRSQQPRRHCTCVSLETLFEDIHILGASALTSFSRLHTFIFQSLALRVVFILFLRVVFFFASLRSLACAVLCTHFTFGFVVFPHSSLSHRFSSYCELHHYIKIYSIALFSSLQYWLTAHVCTTIAYMEMLVNFFCLVPTYNTIT